MFWCCTEACSILACIQRRDPEKGPFFDFFGGKLDAPQPLPGMSYGYLSTFGMIDCPSQAPDESEHAEPEEQEVRDGTGGGFVTRRRDYTVCRMAGLDFFWFMERGRFCMVSRLCMVFECFWRGLRMVQSLLLSGRETCGLDLWNDSHFADAPVSRTLPVVCLRRCCGVHGYFKTF